MFVLRVDAAMTISFPYTVQPQPAAASRFFRTTKQAEVMKVHTSIRVCPDVKQREACKHLNFGATEFRAAVSVAMATLCLRQISSVNVVLQPGHCELLGCSGLNWSEAVSFSLKRRGEESDPGSAPLRADAHTRV